MHACLYETRDRGEEDTWGMVCVEQGEVVGRQEVDGHRGGELCVCMCVCGCEELFSVFGAPLQLVWGAAMRECGEVCAM
jgi:hypothetical protein